jgi:hypothetical protein
MGILTITGWWLTYPSEKYQFVSWGDDIPDMMGNHKIPWFQTTNQFLYLFMVYGFFKHIFLGPRMGW